MKSFTNQVNSLVQEHFSGCDCPLGSVLCHFCVHLRPPLLLIKQHGLCGRVLCFTIRLLFFGQNPMVPGSFIASLHQLWHFSVYFRMSYTVIETLG